MDITVTRFTRDQDTTLSLIRVDGDFVCFGLEDQPRPDKVMGETRIPAGKYVVELRSEGGMTKRYAEKFPDIHRGMLWIRSVPGFEWIYIHVGNTHENTEGCILTGRGCDATQGLMRTTNSMKAYRDLYTMVVDAAARGDLYITIEDKDT